MIRTTISVRDLGSDDDIRYSVQDDQTVGEFVEETLGHPLNSVQVTVNGESIDPDETFEPGDVLVISQKKYASGSHVIINVQNLGEDSQTRFGVDEDMSILDFIEDTLGHDVDAVQVSLNGTPVEDFDDVFEAGQTLVISQKKYASGNGNDKALA